MARKRTSLSAGYAICGVLETALDGRVSGVFPIICKDSDAKYPFLTYARQGSVREATKSGYNADMDDCDIVVRVFDDDYERGLGLIEDARAALEGKTLAYDDGETPDDTLTVRCARVSSSDEDWDTQGAYVQAIVVSCKIR